jgi:hypothetical protein
MLEVGESTHLKGAVSKFECESPETTSAETNLVSSTRAAKHFAVDVKPRTLGKAVVGIVIPDRVYLNLLTRK